MSIANVMQYHITNLTKPLLGAPESFSSSETRVVLVVGSRLLYQGSDKGERWRIKFLETNKLFHVVNLSDLRKENLLFGRGSSTSQPALVVHILSNTSRLPNDRAPCCAENGIPEYANVTN